MQLIELNSIFLILIDSLEKAITTPPNLGKTNIIVLTTIYGLFTLTWGWISGFLDWNLCQSRQLAIRIMFTSLFAPAILEELFFRVILLPYPDAQIMSESDLIWSGFSLSLFVIYHPLNALTFFPQGRPVFFSFHFLILAAALGATCNIAYWLSGSLWIPVLIHWLAVVFWLLCFGGLEKLNYSDADSVMMSSKNKDSN